MKKHHGVKASFNTEDYDHNEMRLLAQDATFKHWVVIAVGPTHEIKALCDILNARMTMFTEMLQNKED